MARYEIKVIKNPDLRNFFEKAEIFYSEQVLTEDEIYRHTTADWQITRPSSSDVIPESLIGNPNVWKFSFPSEEEEVLDPSLPDPRDGVFRSVNYFVLRNENEELYGYCRMVPPVDLNKSYTTYFAVNVNESNIVLDIVFDKVEIYEEHYTNRNDLQHVWFGREWMQFPWNGLYYLGTTYGLFNFKDSSLIETAANAVAMVNLPKSPILHFSETEEEDAIVPSQDNVVLEEGSVLSSHVYFNLSKADLPTTGLSALDFRVSSDATLGIFLFALHKETDGNHFNWIIYIYGSGSNLWNHRIKFPTDYELPENYFYSKVFFWQNKIILVLDTTMYVLSDSVSPTYFPLDRDLVPRALVEHNLQNEDIQSYQGILVPENFDLCELIYNVPTSKFCQFNGVIDSNTQWMEFADVEEYITQIGGIFDYNGTERNAVNSFLSSATQIKALYHINPTLKAFILDSGVITIDAETRYCRFYVNNLRTPFDLGLISFKLGDNEFFNGDINGISIISEDKLTVLHPNVDGYEGENNEFHGIVEYSNDTRGYRGFTFSLFNKTVL